MTAGVRPLPSRRADRRGFAVPLVLLIMTAALVSVVLSLAFGSERIPVEQVWQVVRAHLSDGSVTDAAWDTIVWQLRLPRALLALVVGAGLSLAGAGMQTLVRNPLADPYLLGISSGASVGATLVITAGVFAGAGVYALSVGALLGALGAAIVVYAIAVAQGGLTPLRLVLSGVRLRPAGCLGDASISCTPRLRHGTLYETRANSNPTAA